MTIAFRDFVIVPVAFSLMAWLAGCRTPAPTANDQPKETVTIVCEAPGWSTEEIEANVTQPLEAALNGVAGLQQLSSVSRPTRAVIHVTFDQGTASLQARQIVAEQIGTVPIPNDVDVKIVPASSGHMLLIAMSVETASKRVSEDDEPAVPLRDLADISLRQRLLTLTGVARVVMAGGRQKQYQVFPSAEELAAFEITASELATAIRRANTVVGELPLDGNNEIVIRSLSQLENLNELADTVVKASPDGAPVRLRDIADVRIGWVSDIARDTTEEEQRDPTQMQAVVLAVQLQPDADESAVNKKVNDVVHQLSKQLPQGVTIERTIDQQLDRHVRQLVANLQQDFPPNVELERVSSKQLGDVIAITHTRLLTVKLFGPDLAELRERTNEVQKRMNDVPGVVNLQVHAPIAEPQLHIEIDRDKATHFGLTSEQVDDAVSIAAGDHVVCTVREGDQQYDVVLKRDESDNEAMQIGNHTMRTASDTLVPIGSVARIVPRATPSAIYRENGQRVVFISCEVKDRTKTEVESDIKKSLGPLPSGYFIDISH